MRKYKIILSILLASFIFQENTFAQSAKQIIETSEKAIRGDTSISVYEIVIKTRRWKRTLLMKSYEIRKQRKSFSKIYSPPKDAGNRFLLIKHNMWHYVPKLQRTIKISPSMMLQSWMGSDFTNDDIVKESSKVTDYTHKILGKETIEGIRCFKLELKPKPGSAVVWGKIIYYAREKDYLPVKQEFYNEHGVLKKFMTCSEFKKMHDRVIPTVYVMKTVGKKDKYTLMRIKDVRFNKTIGSRVFSFQNLTRR